MIHDASSEQEEVHARRRARDEPWRAAKSESCVRRKNNLARLAARPFLPCIFGLTARGLTSANRETHEDGSCHMKKKDDLLPGERAIRLAD